MTWRVLVLGTAAAALTLTIGATASAEEGDEVSYDRVGGYFQLSGVYSADDFSEPVSGTSTGGFSLRTGNRFHQYCSVEFQYEFLAARDVEVTQATPPPLEASVYSHHITMNFRSYPLSGLEKIPGFVQPFIIAGLGVGIFDTEEGDDTGFAARFGGGVDLYTTEHIMVSLEAVYALSAGGGSVGGAEIDGGELRRKDLNHVSVSVGVAYRF